MKKSVGLLFAATSAILWGTYGIFSTFLNNFGLTTATISMIGQLFIFVFFTVFTLKDGWRNYLIPKKFIPIMILYGFICALESFSAVKAYTHLPIAMVSVIIYCNLFLLIIFSRLLFQEQLTKKKIFACVMAVLGVAMVVNVFGAEGHLNLIGLLWTVIAMICWAVVIICEKLLLNANIKGTTILSFHGIISTLFLSMLNSPAQFAHNISASFSTSGWPLILFIMAFGLCTKTISYYLYMIALKRLEPALVQIVWTIDPVTACILGFIIFRQTLLPIQIIGIIIILAIVIWLHLQQRKEERATLNI
jgi:drug/metabolite transporter (DMT)-like permease